MTTTTMHEPVTAAPCPGCGDLILTATRAQTGDQLTLDPALRAGGTYELDGDVMVRRTRRAIADEWALCQKVYGGGYNAHECAPDREVHWTDR